MRYFDEIEEAEWESESEEERDDFELEYEKKPKNSKLIEPAMIHPLLGLGFPVSNELEMEEDQEEEIIGQSDSRSPIRNTKKTPYRFICRLQMVYQDPAVNGGVAVRFGGTGTLISPRHVLTAAHNVRTTFFGKVLNPRSVTAAPGQDRSDTPFGVVKVTGFKMKKEFENDTNVCHDYALLTLEKEIGSQTFKSLGNKPLGWWGDFEKGNNTRLEFVEPAKLKRVKLTVAGYAGDKCGYLPIQKYKKGDRCQYALKPPLSAELVTCINSQLHASAQFGATGRMVDPLPAGGGAHLFAYDADTCRGHSGSPVWTDNGGLRYLIGVHTGSWVVGKSTCDDPEPAGSRPDANRAMRVTTGMLDNIRKWKA